MTFQKGQSGNPAGRERGSRNKATIAVQEALESEAEEIARKAVDMAKAGQIGAVRLCMDRLMSRRKDEAVPYALPPLEKAADAVAAMAGIAAAVGDGDLTPDEAAKLARVVEIYLEALEAHDFEERLCRLEAADVAARDGASTAGNGEGT
jgi:hypothetical protein